MSQPPSKDKEYDPWTNVRARDNEPLIFVEREPEFNPQPIKKFDKRILAFYGFVVGLPIAIAVFLFVALGHRTLPGRWTDANVDNKILEATKVVTVETYDFKKDGTGTLAVDSIATSSKVNNFTYRFADGQLTILPQHDIDFESAFTFGSGNLDLPKPTCYTATVPIMGQLLILRKCDDKGHEDPSDSGHYFRRL